MLAGATTGPATAEDRIFAVEMLPHVSRTFASAIDALPGELSEPVRLSYLLCRVADTIEDASRLPPEVRRDFLIRLGWLLADRGSDGTEAERFAEEVACALRIESAEHLLVSELHRLMRLLHSLSPSRRQVIERWIQELTLGMARFVGLENEDGNGWTALATCDDLVAYEYYVAGTVGCLLNDLFHLHIFGPNGSSTPRMRELAVSFGLGLQGTNIIQDVSDDRDRGWSYIPEEIARRHGSSTARLHRPEERAAAMGAIHEMAWRAIADLDDGLEYVLLLPRRIPRIRLFCLWPLLLAVRTLTRVAGDEAVLLRRIRITRAEVRELTRKTLWSCLSNRALRRLYRRERARFAEAAGGDTAGGPSGDPAVGEAG